MSARTIAIINPKSGGGRTLRRWPEIARALEAVLGPVEARFTDHAPTAQNLPAANLTRQALREGATLILAVGGDGTINEVVNGFFDQGQPINPQAQLGLVPAGTGGDFRRTFDISDTLDETIARLARGTTRTVDLGRLSFLADDGTPTDRYFANIASFGMSGAVDRAVNRARFSKLFGGTFTFFWGSLTTALRYRPQRVRVQSDAGLDTVLNVGTAAIANGRFFGGGMMMAPNAAPDDGLFDVVILCDTTIGEIFTSSGSIYEGKHIDNPKTLSARARWIEATPENSGEAVLLDIDGEAPGRLPARFEIVPQALTLRC